MNDISSRHLLCLSLNPVPGSSCQHACSIPHSFPGSSPVPCLIKQQLKTKPSQALRHCVCRVTLLCHVPCMPPLCCCTPVVGMAGLGGPGLHVQAPGAWGSGQGHGGRGRKASCSECPGPVGLMAICPEEMSFSGQVSEAGQRPPSYLCCHSSGKRDQEERRCWGRGGVGKSAQNRLGGDHPRCVILA